jgi:thymidylate kinase
VLIIIEGIDCSGKTTLANAIAEIIQDRTNHDVEILHRGIPKEHPLDEYEIPLVDYDPNGTHSIICDRWHVGADIYGPIMRNDDGLDSVQRWHMNRFLSAKGALLVYTEAPFDVLTERMSQRGEDYIKSEQIREIVDLYQVVLKELYAEFTVFWSPDGEHDARGIAALGSLQELWANGSGSIHSYVGHPRPERVFVGKSPTAIAFMPYEGTPSYELVKMCMNEEPITVGLLDVEDLTTDTWGILGDPILVALDEHTTEWCDNKDIPYVWIEDYTA